MGAALGQVLRGALMDTCALLLAGVLANMHGDWFSWVWVVVFGD